VEGTLNEQSILNRAVKRRGVSMNYKEKARPINWGLGLADSTHQDSGGKGLRRTRKGNLRGVGIRREIREKKRVGVELCGCKTTEQNSMKGK